MSDMNFPVISIAIETEEIKDHYLEEYDPFSPLCNSVCVVSIYPVAITNNEDLKKTFYIDDGKNEKNDFRIKCNDEKELLKKVWDHVTKINPFLITYCGISFTMPFLAFRSIVNKVKPNPVILADMKATRFYRKRVFDLREEYSIGGKIETKSLDQLYKSVMLESAMNYESDDLTDLSAIEIKVRENEYKVFKISELYCHITEVIND
jgi:predicted PolB exonuclease-like 3'-5' exonuclease